MKMNKKKKITRKTKKKINNPESEFSDPYRELYDDIHQRLTNKVRKLESEFNNSDDYFTAETKKIIEANKKIAEQNYNDLNSSEDDYIHYMSSEHDPKKFATDEDIERFKDSLEENVNNNNDMDKIPVKYCVLINFADLFKSETERSEAWQAISGTARDRSVDIHHGYIPLQRLSNIGITFQQRAENDKIHGEYRSEYYVKLPLIREMMNTLSNLVQRHGPSILIDMDD